MNTYVIDRGVLAPRAEIEADSYHRRDGFFIFTTSDRGAGVSPRTAALFRENDIRSIVVKPTPEADPEPDPAIEESVTSTLVFENSILLTLHGACDRPDRSERIAEGLGEVWRLFHTKFVGSHEPTIKIYTLNHDVQIFAEA